MRKNVIIAGLVLFVLGFVLGFLSGATFGTFTIPLIYGSNQILWMFIGVIGFIIGIVGLFLKKKK